MSYLDLALWSATAANWLSVLWLWRKQSALRQTERDLLDAWVAFDALQQERWRREFARPQALMEQYEERG